MAIENKLWLPPLSPKDQKRLTRLQKNRKRTIIKWLGFADKTLWDWLQLLGVLAIPIVVAFGTLAFTNQQALSSQKASERQHQTDLQIAEDQQQETRLHTYLDRLSELLLNGNLSKSKPSDEVRNVARVQTLTTLPTLNPARKGIILLFLYDSGLITGSQKIVDLSGANLSGVTWSQLHSDTPLPVSNPSTEPLPVAFAYATAVSEAFAAGVTPIDLSGINLSGANLAGANLAGANLAGARLNKADLSQTNLYGADLNLADLTGASLSGAILTKANLRGAYLKDTDLSSAVVTNEQLATTASLQSAIMPDGSIHP